MGAAPEIEPPLRLTPPYPDRPARFASRWRILVPSSKPINGIAGWPRQAFEARTLRWRLGPLDVLIINDPDAIRRVLVDNPGNYTKPRLVRRILGRSGSENLVIAEGDDWRMQRRVMAPVFTPAAVGALAPMIGQAAAERSARWPRRGRVNVAGEAGRLAFEIISRALFSGERPLGSRLAAARISDALRALAVFRLDRLVGLDLPTLNPAQRRAEAGFAEFGAGVERIVDARLAAGSGPGTHGGDFLGRLLDAFTAELPRERARALAIDNSVAFYIAGHETTANAIAWSLMLLAADGRAQERARTEALAARDAGGDAKALAGMTFTRAVLDEALRLYPSAPRFDREAVGEDELAGERVRPGQIISIWPWLLHRNRLLWDDPDAFDPSRFVGDAPKARPRYAYLPFGAGPRVCIGAQLSITEALGVLSVWLAERRFTPEPGWAPEPFADITLKPRGGLPLLVEPV